MPDMELIWKDRKRILGMPITFTKYSMSKDRLFLETGLLNMNQVQVCRQEKKTLVKLRAMALKEG